MSICCLLFFVTLLNGKQETALQWGFIPANSEPIKIVTSMFLHGGHWHLLGNMVFLWMFGDNIEDVVGSLFFLFCYFLAGIVATVTYSTFHQESVIPLVGASGALSGIIGMYLVFFPKVSAELVIYFFYWEVHKVKTTIYVAVGCWFAMQFLLFLLIEETEASKIIRVAFSAHLGGFLAGVIFGYIFVWLGYVNRYVRNGKKHWLFGYAT